MIEMSYDDWKAKGTELFGADFMKWKFVCPVCKNVAVVEDFQKFADRGANPNSATCECIGRQSRREGSGAMICRRCGCSELNPCITRFGETCAWAIPGVLCSFCVTAQEFEIVELLHVHFAGRELAAQIPTYSPAQQAEAARLYQEVCR